MFYFIACCLPREFTTSQLKMTTTTTTNNNNNNNNNTGATNDKMTKKACSVKVNFRGDSRDIELSSPATLSGLQEAVGSTFGIELPTTTALRSAAGTISDGDLSFTYRDSDGDDIVFDTDSELSLALRLCPELEVQATRTLDRDDDTKDAEQQHGGPEAKQQQQQQGDAPEAAGDIYDVAARNLRENNGVPSISAASLQHTLALLQLRPRRLAVQGLAPWWLLRNADMPLLPPKQTAAPDNEEGALAADGTETSSAASNKKDGPSLEPAKKPDEAQNEKNDAAEDAAPVAVDAAAHRSDTGVAAAGAAAAVVVAVDGAPVHPSRDCVDVPSDKEGGSDAAVDEASHPIAEDASTATATGIPVTTSGDSVDDKEEQDDKSQRRQDTESTAAAVAAPSVENKPDTAAEGASPAVTAVDTLAADDNATVVTDATGTGVAGGPAATAVTAATAATAAAGAVDDTDSNNNNNKRSNTDTAHKDPIHAALEVGGVHLPLGEMRPLLSALGVHPHLFVRLGLVDRKALYGARRRGGGGGGRGDHPPPRGGLGGFLGVGGWVLGWGKHVVGIGRPREDGRCAGAGAPPSPPRLVAPNGGGAVKA